MLTSLRFAVLTCLLATLVSTLRVYPHQLAYFNELSGGPENGYRHMLGSAVDYGQDLFFVKEWLWNHGIDPQSVDWSGTGFQGLDSLLPKPPGRTSDLHVVSVNRLPRPQTGTAGEGPRPVPIGYANWLVEMTTTEGVSQ